MVNFDPNDGMDTAKFWWDHPWVYVLALVIVGIII